MKAVALQIAPVWEDALASRRLIESRIAESPAERGDLVVLPEMSDTGWSLAAARVVREDAVEWAADVARRHGIHLVTGFARPLSGPLSGVPADGPTAANAAVVAHPDGSTGPVYDKFHPFGFTAEPRVYAAGRRLVLERIGPFTAALTICYDLRFPELHRAAVDRGADLLLTIANWPRIRAGHWRALAIARAIENQAFHVAVNRVGSDPHHDYGGGSLIVSPTGEVLAEGDDEEECLSAPLDPEVLREWRAKFPALADRRDDLRGDPSGG